MAGVQPIFQVESIEEIELVFDLSKDSTLTVRGLTLTLLLSRCHSQQAFVTQFDHLRHRNKTSSFYLLQLLYP